MHLFCFNGAYSLLWTFDAHKSIYYLKAHSSKIPLVPCLNQMIQGVQIIQGGTLRQSCIFVNLNTLTCSLIITMESKERHHFWKNTIGAYQIRIKFTCPTFLGQKYRVIEKLVEFNVLKCVFDQILRLFLLYD